MIRFINRDDIISWIKSHTTRRSVIRTIEEGAVEYLGGFSQVVSYIKAPIFICRITSIYNRTWIIGVYTNGAITYLNAVPWQFYVGGESTYSPQNGLNYVNMSFNSAVFWND